MHFKQNMLYIYISPFQTSWLCGLHKYMSSICNRFNYREHAWQHIWCSFVLCAFTLCFLKDAPHPTDKSVSVLALNKAGKVRVTWSRPTLGPGQRITRYSVQYKRRGTTSYTTRSVSGSSTTSYTITNLNLGTVYEVRVASVGRLGLGGYCCGSGKEVITYNSEWTNCENNEE